MQGRVGKKLLWRLAILPVLLASAFLALQAVRLGQPCHEGSLRLSSLVHDAGGPSPGAGGMQLNMDGTDNVPSPALAAACNCSAVDMRFVLRAWRVFARDLPTRPACHPLRAGSDLTAGWQNGSLWLHPGSNKRITELENVGVYLAGALRWFKETNFTGPLSFAVNCADDGLPASRADIEPSSYCLHGSNPPWGCAGAVVLPVHPTTQSPEALAWYRTEAERLLSEVPFVNRIRKAVWRGAANGGYRVRLVPQLQNVAGLSASFESANWRDFTIHHRVLLALDGFSFSSLYKRALLAGAAVVRVHDWDLGPVGPLEWYEPMLTPYEHYVPALPTPDSVATAVQYLLSNDSRAEAVAAAGLAAARHIFSDASMQCYVCWTLRMAAEHQAMHSSCPNATFENLGWQPMSAEDATYLKEKYDAINSHCCYRDAGRK